MSLPPRTPEQTADAMTKLRTHCAACQHPFAAHAPDGCRLCQAQRSRATTRCTGWQPPAPAGQDGAGGLSSGDPLTDTIHDILARHWPGFAGAEFMVTRNELVNAARSWAAAALGIQAE